MFDIESYAREKEDKNTSNDDDVERVEKTRLIETIDDSGFDHSCYRIDLIDRVKYFRCWRQICLMGRNKRMLDTRVENYKTPTPFPTSSTKTKQIF